MPSCENRKQLSNSAAKKLLKAKNQAQPPPGARSRFREVEKQYLTRNPPPDYTEVLDLAADLLPAGTIRHKLRCKLEEDHGDHCGRQLRIEAQVGYTLDKHPGLILIPGALSHNGQRALVTHCMRDFTRQPNLNNLDTHYRLPKEGLWFHYEKCESTSSQDADLQIEPILSEGVCAPLIASHPPNTRRLIQESPITSEIPREVLVTQKDKPSPATNLKSVAASELIYKLRWTNLGLMYHWSSKSYHYEDVLNQGREAMIPVPSLLSKFTVDLLDVIPHELRPSQEDWSDFQPESGIINFYQLRDTLMGHIDQSELVEDKPLVSLSCGHTAVFLIGGVTRDIKPTAIFLRSGDALIMSGACRRVFHGIPRVVEGSLPSHLGPFEHWPEDDHEASTEEEQREWTVFADYLKTTRINVNIRQVFPKNYL